MSKEGSNTPESEEAAEGRSEQAPTEHLREAGRGGPTDGPATITIQRRWAIGVVAVMAALLLLLATAVVIEADGDDDGPPFVADPGLPFGPGGGGPGGPGFERPMPPFGGGAPQFERPPGFDEDERSQDGSQINPDR